MGVRELQGHVQGWQVEVQYAGGADSLEGADRPRPQDCRHHQVVEEEEEGGGPQALLAQPRVPCVAQGTEYLA